MMKRLFQLSLLAVVVCGAAASSAQAQSRSLFKPPGVRIFPSGTSGFFAQCGVATDTPRPLALGFFSSPPPGFLAFELVLDCYNNPQMSNPPLVISSGLAVVDKSLACPAQAPFMDSVRISVVSTNPNTTYAYSDDPVMPPLLPPQQFGSPAPVSASVF